MIILINSHCHSNENLEEIKTVKRFDIRILYSFGDHCRTFEVAQCTCHQMPSLYKLPIQFNTSALSN